MPLFLAEVRKRTPAGTAAVREKVAKVKEEEILLPPGLDAEETNDQKWAATKPGAMEAKAGKPDGALLLVAEGQPKPRVRVMRAEMDGGVVVKEMSETAVLERLERDLVELEKKFV